MPASSGPPVAPRPSAVDRWLRWGLAVTVAVSVVVLSYGTLAVYQGQAPIPDRVQAWDGTPLYTKSDILAGKALFQQADLMDFGTLYGNGAYFGPDWGADYLHRESTLVHEYEAGSLYGTTYAGLTPAQAAVVDEASKADLRHSAVVDGTLTLSPAVGWAQTELWSYYEDLFLNGNRSLGLHAHTVGTTAEADQLTSFLAWVAWTMVAERPGQTYSYTNNWPYDPSVGNTPTDSMVFWTIASIVLFGAATLGIALAYRRWVAAPKGALRLPPAPAPAAAAPPPSPTASQRVTQWWFLLVPLLMLGQGLLGSVMAHLYADRLAAFDPGVFSLLPFNILKAWHTQLAIAWIALAWLGAGLFLVPVITGREPKGQAYLAGGLLLAFLGIVVGGAIGIWQGVTWGTSSNWLWVGNQGLEYLQIGLLFQILLLAGLVAWGFVLLRAFWPTLRKTRSFGSLEALLLYSGIGIAFVYAFGLVPVATATTSFTITDYWRWWVVHLWVENAFEFFTVVVIGFALLAMGLLERVWVERTAYFELILVFGAGIVGTGHHFYWVGDPAVWLALGAMFSIFEVVPLAFLLLRAWQQYRVLRGAGTVFPQRTAFLFFTSASVWNLVGAGAIGAVINTPLANFYEHGTFLTAAHAHASMFGAFGLLAVGLVYFATRLMTSATPRSERWAVRALWMFNGAIILWLALNLLPIGAAQLQASIEHGFWYARSLAFYDGWTWAQWLRMPGDLLFLGGAAVVLLDLALRYRAGWAARRLRPAPQAA